MFKSKILLVICALSFVILISGCVQIQEVGKGTFGISTKVLEDNRKAALKKEFNYDLITCHTKIRSILKVAGSYIYCDDLQKDMLALYISEEDTTPVGVFLTEIDKEKTLVEISSPSTSGKELVSTIVFEGLAGNPEPALKKGRADASKAKTEY